MLEINKIHLGNCYELIKQIPDKSIDLIIIDPPYEFTNGGGDGCFGTSKRKHDYLEVAKKTNKVNAHKIRQRESIRHLSSGIDYKILDELDRCMKEINIYVWCSKAMISSILNHYESKECNIDILTWHKTNPLPTANNTYLNDTEYCIFAREKGVKVYGDFKTKKKFYVTGLNIEDKKLYKHPTIKPLNIIKNLITNSSLAGGVILDCFSGSGTTCVAAKELERNFIGIEVNPKYYQISIDRLNGINASGQTSIFTDFEE